MRTADDLIERFRADVDDRAYDPDDESDLLYTRKDIEHYLVESQRRFVAETHYLHEVLRETVVANDPIVRLSRRVLEIRGRTAYLVTADVRLEERAANEIYAGGDDYGQTLGANPFSSDRTGRPLWFTADLDTDEIHLFPTPEVDDTLVFSAYIEAPDSCMLIIRNPRHINMLLDGMKAMAYRKQDSDAYDPNQAERWERRFQDNIDEVYSERQRRRRKPGLIRYGGL